MQTLRNLLLGAVLVFASQSFAQLRTVDYVDVGQYLGTWYQIARNPLIFEGNCACSRQVLAAQADGNVSVYNSCNDYTVTGPLREIRGVAYSQDPVSNSKFTVDFNLPHTGQYWIIGVDSHYRYAVVSDPSKQSLYVLSKTPTLEPALYAEAVATAALQLDTSKLILTEQMGCTYP
jgi:apolipoprotein D and lipocalin family protein